MYLKETVVSKQKSHFFSRNAGLARFPEARGISSHGGSSSAKRWGPNYVAEKIKCKCKGRTGSWESLDFTLKWKTSEKGETACSLGLSCCSCDGLSASHSTLLLLYFFFFFWFSPSFRSLSSLLSPFSLFEMKIPGRCHSSLTLLIFWQLSEYEVEEHGVWWTRQ